VDGGRFDPALINFKNDGVGKIAAFFPKALGSLKRRDKVRSFNKDTLFEHINGHAPAFIGAGFLNLYVGEYIKPGSKKPDLQVEIYDMGKALHAFGIQSEESRGALRFVENRMESRTSQGVNFSKGRYYVKVIAYDPKSLTESNLKAIIAGAGQGGKDLNLSRLFPDLGRARRTRFIKESYRGMGFLKNVLEREYDQGGRKVTVFLVQSDKKKIASILKKFDEFFKESGAKSFARSQNGLQYIRVADKFEGDYFLLPRGDVLYGVFGAKNASILRKFKTGKKNGPPKNRP